MNEQLFRSEMRRAEIMRRTLDRDRANYWAGYIRGLRRLYHGENFGTPEEHTFWLLLVVRPDRMLQQRGQGYRDGFEFDEANLAGANRYICCLKKYIVGRGQPRGGQPPGGLPPGSLPPGG